MLKCRLVLVVLVFVLVLPGVVLGQEKENPLVNLARKIFPDLSISETNFLAALQIGMHVDFQDKDPENNDPAKSKNWGKHRVIRGKIISWLCRNTLAQKHVKTIGLILRGAKIKGDIDLCFASVPFPLAFQNCSLEEPVYLKNSHLNVLFFRDCFCGSILAEEITVNGSVFIENCVFPNGFIDFSQAKINGNFDFKNSKIFNKDSVAINAVGIRVDGYVRIGSGLIANGKVNFSYAKIGQNFNCNQGKFKNKGGIALEATNADFESSVLMGEGFVSYGEVKIAYSKIKGVLNCNGGIFNNEKKMALSAYGLQVEGYVFLKNPFKAIGVVNFIGAKIRGNFECTGGEFFYAEKLEDLNNENCFSLDADSVKIGGSIYLKDGFHSKGQVWLLNAKIGQELNCIGGKFQNKGACTINANGVFVGRGMLLRKSFLSEGEVNLIGAKIQGSLDCTDGTFINKGKLAINADNAEIQGKVCLRNGFKSEGEVKLARSKIGDDLECDAGKFLNDGSVAINAPSIRVGGSVKMRSHEGQIFESFGEVRLTNSKIRGNLLCLNGKFFNQNGKAIDLSGTEIDGSIWIRNNIQIQGVLDFSNTTVKETFQLIGIKDSEKIEINFECAEIGTLWDAKESWPQKGKLHLDGLTYNHINKNSPSKFSERILWLELQPEFHPQPYEQLAKVFRTCGSEQDGENVLFEKNWLEMKSFSLISFEKLSSLFWWLFSGFGYRPWRSIWIGIIVILGGYFVIKLADNKHIMVPIWDEGISGSEERRQSLELNYLIYSFDLFIPIIDFNHAKNWIANSKKLVPITIKGHPFTLSGKVIRYYLIVHKLAGWFITSLLVLGVAGLIRQ